jgi:hypothetical protein
MSADAMHVRIIPTTKPAPSDETVTDTLDRVELALRLLVADVHGLRARIKADAESPPL